MGTLGTKRYTQLVAAAVLLGFVVLIIHGHGQITRHHTPDRFLDSGVFLDTAAQPFAAKQLFFPKEPHDGVSRSTKDG